MLESVVSVCSAPTPTATPVMVLLQRDLKTNSPPVLVQWHLKVLSQSHGRNTVVEKVLVVYLVNQDMNMVRLHT